MNVEEQPKNSRIFVWWMTWTPTFDWEIGSLTKPKTNKWMHNGLMGELRKLFDVECAFFVPIVFMLLECQMGWWRQLTHEICVILRSPSHGHWFYLKKCIKHKKMAVIWFLALRKYFLSSYQFRNYYRFSLQKDLQTVQLLSCIVDAWGSFVLCLENEMVVFYVAI